MNIVVFTAAVFALLLVAIIIIGGPFVIGKERGIFTASSYLTNLFEAVVLTLLAGRVFGWW